jgi:hypothetical protein
MTDSELSQEIPGALKHFTARAHRLAEGVGIEPARVHRGRVRAQQASNRRLLAEKLDLRLPV